ncbi:MAG: hypothetical protein ACYSYU_00190 [Planctomycetota bacterium]
MSNAVLQVTWQAEGKFEDCPAGEFYVSKGSTKCCEQASTPSQAFLSGQSQKSSILSDAGISCAFSDSYVWYHVHYIKDDQPIELCAIEFYENCATSFRIKGDVEYKNECEKSYNVVVELISDVSRNSKYTVTVKENKA